RCHLPAAGRHGCVRWRLVIEVVLRVKPGGLGELASGVFIAAHVGGTVAVVVSVGIEAQRKLDALVHQPFGEAEAAVGCPEGEVALVLAVEGFARDGFRPQRGLAHFKRLLQFGGSLLHGSAEAFICVLGTGHLVSHCGPPFVAASPVPTVTSQRRRSGLQPPRGSRCRLLCIRLPNTANFRSCSLRPSGLSSGGRRAGTGRQLHAPNSSPSPAYGTSRR